MTFNTCKFKFSTVFTKYKIKHNFYWHIFLKQYEICLYFWILHVLYQLLENLMEVKIHEKIKQGILELLFLMTVWSSHIKYFNFAYKYQGIIFWLFVGSHLIHEKYNLSFLIIFKIQKFKLQLLELLLELLV